MTWQVSTGQRFSFSLEAVTVHRTLEGTLRTLFQGLPEPVSFIYFLGLVKVFFFFTS